ncbi:MAG: hypothetical protein F4Y00_06175 [Bacteroidetes bacterium SB0662_bin_6]|nr:hypothetical protein [Bacteroidetes bacterium SB0668_bin_1]MYE04540.1 hypothetical protein [Bacteroidetes bacterium SB0662_bin_6]
MVIRYPITNEVRNALQRFPRIAEEIRSKLPGSGRSELEIVRLLGNTHYEHIEALLAFIDDKLPTSGSIGKRVLDEKDLLKFHRALSEFDLLVHLQDTAGTASAYEDKVSPRSNAKRYDIDLTAGGSQIRIEVYCPADFFGYQLVGRYLPMMFKYLEVDMGFEVALRLEHKNENHGSWNPFFANDIGGQTDVDPWLDSLNAEAKQWIMEAKAGDHLQFPGPIESLLLSVTLEHRDENPDWRLVSFLPPGQSSDTRLFFEMDTPKSTAGTQWGPKLLDKLQKRQCGPPSPDYLRLLVVDFSLADTGWPDFICWPDTAKRLAETFDLLVEETGPPLPYDAVLPAQLGRECGFGRVIPLDNQRTKEIERVVQAASLDRPCIPHPAGDQKKKMEEMRRYAASRQRPAPSDQHIKNDPDFRELLDSISALQHGHSG